MNTGSKHNHESTLHCIVFCDFGVVGQQPRAFERHQKYHKGSNTWSKKQYQQEAEQELRDTLEHNKEYALQRAKELCADFGISDA